MAGIATRKESTYMISQADSGVYARCPALTITAAQGHFKVSRAIAHSPEQVHWLEQRIGNLPFRPRCLIKPDTFVP